MSTFPDPLTNDPSRPQGLVAKLREGEDFGQLALLNDAPRAATIILREDNCHFLRVDKQDYIRILKVDPRLIPAYPLGLCRRFTHTRMCKEHIPK